MGHQQQHLPLVSHLNFIPGFWACFLGLIEGELYPIFIYKRRHFSLKKIHILFRFKGELYSGVAQGRAGDLQPLPHHRSLGRSQVRAQEGAQQVGKA